MYIFTDENGRYTKLENSGTLQSLLQNADLNMTRPFLEDDIRNAIGSLKESTASIKRRTEMLSAQCEFAKRKLRDDEEYQRNCGKALADLQRRNQLERQHISAAVCFPE